MLSQLGWARPVQMTTTLYRLPGRSFAEAKSTDTREAFAVQGFRRGPRCRLAHCSWRYSLQGGGVEANDEVTSEPFLGY